MFPVPTKIAERGLLIYRWGGQIHYKNKNPKLSLH